MVLGSGCSGKSLTATLKGSLRNLTVCQNKGQHSSKEVLQAGRNWYQTEMWIHTEQWRMLEMDSLGANRKLDTASEFPELLTRRMCFCRNSLMIPMGSEGQDQSSSQVTTCCCCSVTRSCLTLCNLIDYSTPGSPVLQLSPGVCSNSCHWVSDPSHPLPPPSPLPSISPSIKVFSNESVLHIRWPKYGSFSISPSNEYSGLISCKIDWFDLAVQWTLKRLLQHNLKASPLQCSAFFMAQCSYPYMTRVLLTTSNLSQAPDALRPWCLKGETLPWTILTLDNDCESALGILRIQQIITECFLRTFLSQTLLCLGLSLLIIK